MLIDTSSNLAGAPSNSPKKNLVLSTEITKLISEMKLEMGQKLDAAVTKLTSISDEERSLLLELKSKDNPQIVKKFWESILKNPELKHVELNINQKLINTLTTAPLVKNQTIKLILNIQGLQISSDSISNNIEKKPTTLALKLPATKSNFENLTNTNLKVIEETLKQSLSKALPTAQNHDKLFNLLDKMVGAIREMPSVKVTKSFVSLLKTLDNLPKKYSVSIPHNSTPSVEGLKTVMKQGGTFYEQRLFANKPADISPLTQTLTTMKSSLSATQTGMTNADQPTLRLSLSPEIRSNPKAISAVRQLGGEIIENDLKGSLIQLSQWLQNAASSADADKKLNSNDVIAKLWLNILNMNTLKGSPDTTKDLKVVYQTLQQVIQQSISRIQVQQYRSLNTSQKETNSPTQATVNLDIPVKTPDGYSTIHMQLFEPQIKEEDYKRGKDKKTKRKAKWNIFMELELEDEGNFSIDLSVCDKSLHGTFWAENEPLRLKTEANLKQLKEDLENKGLNVTDLRCSKNLPPKQSMRMNFSLIDIKT